MNNRVPQRQLGPNGDVRLVPQPPFRPGALGSRPRAGAREQLWRPRPARAPSPGWTLRHTGSGRSARPPYGAVLPSARESPPPADDEPDDRRPDQSPQAKSELEKPTGGR